MAYTNYFILLSAFLLIILSQTSSAQPSFRPKALVLPATKDSSTGQYVAEVKQRTPLVPVKVTIDLGGQYLWVDCEQGYVSSTYKPSRCRSAQCSLANSQACGDCFSGPKPGCNNDTCGLSPDNTIIRLGTIGELAQDVLALESTNGNNPGQVVSVPNLLFTCAPTFLLEGLASGVKGMAGLGKSKIGLPSQLASAFSFKRKFAICLSSSKGVIFFGDGPYNFLPNHDLSSGLTYVPLLTNPVSTAGSYFEGESSVEYFIGVKSIRVNNADVPLNTTLLKISSDGFGGTKISNVDKYMTLEPSIYKAVTDAFVKAASNVPRVNAVAPFSICYNSKNFLSTRLGLNVPLIELVLQSSSVSWQIYGANSMVDVGNGVVCLGILDGSLVNPNTNIVRTSVVIGAHQIEDNLLQFDLAASRLGFSSLLYGQRTTCGNFNFTSVA
ncbi:hypothetical protein Leryth_026321 [Lithospermum erythrorhizon]|nr:hypothetical protein Leryth_026321 [Lithospermum erythrorhizon]